MKPSFVILANGRDITSRLIGYGTRLTITDGVGEKGDRIELEITDKDGLVEEPTEGTVLRVAAGYDKQLRDFGSFIVDQVTVSGYPQAIMVFAQSVDAKSVQKERRTKAFSQDNFPTYGSIFSKVAGDVGLTLRIDPAISSAVNQFEAQTEESGLVFLSRIAKKLDAGVTVKDGNLVVVKQGEGTSASGKGIPAISVRPRHNLIGYSVTVVGKPKFSSVKASWFDRKKVKHSTIVKSGSTDGPEYVLRDPYQSEEDADRAAEAKVKDLSRAQGNATFEVVGDPTIQAEAYINVTGVKRSANGLWRVVEVTHTFSATSAYTTSIRCETPTGGPKEN